MRQPVFDVRAGERATVALAFATLFSFMLGHGVLETARDALFLSSHPPEHLPFVYLAIAVGGLLVARVAAVVRAASARRLPIALGAIALGTACLAPLVARGGPVVSYALYVWSALAATGATVEMWQFLGDRFSVDQAKRIFGFVGAGAVLGVASGSLLASLLAPRVMSAGLVVASAVPMGVAAVFPSLMASWPDPGAIRLCSRAAEVARAEPSVLEVLRTEPYARKLLTLAVLATSALTVADFLFKTSVVRAIEADDLAVFLGRFYAAVNVAGLFVQMLATSWLLRTMGASRGLLLLPLLLLAGAAAFTVAPTLSLVLGMKVADGSLRHSVQRIGTEILFLPLSDRARRAAKGVIEVAGHRGAQALASGGILAATHFAGATRLLSVMLVMLAASWILVLFRTSTQYVELFRDYVRAGAADVRAPLPELDVRALEVLLIGLHSPDEREVLAALRLLERHHKAQLVPPLLVYHPSLAVALEALELMARNRRREVAPLLGALLAGDDPERRAAALRTHHAVSADARVLDAHAADATPRARATIMVALMGRDETRSEVRARIEEIVRGDDLPMRRALARAIAEDAHERWTSTLVALAGDRDLDVRLHVADAAQVMESAELVPRLVDMLAVRQLRDRVRDALLAIGDRAIPALMNSLESTTTALDVRRHLPRTLSRFRSPAVAGFLLQRLPQEKDGMTRFKILYAVWRMKNAAPELSLDEKVLADRAMATLDRIVVLVGYRVSLARCPDLQTPRRRLLEDLLVEKQQRTLDRAFILLSLLHPKEQYDVVFDGLRRDEPRARAASREILSNTLREPFRARVLALVDEVDEATKLGWLGHPIPAHSLRGAVELMARDRSQAIRLMAVSYRAEIGRDPHPEGQDDAPRA